MLKWYLFLGLCISSLLLMAQEKSVADLGFRQLDFNYKGDKVEILILSKAGEEYIQKPLLFYVQGSLPQPIIKFKAGKMYSILPFKKDNFENDYHIAIVSKPGIPIISNIEKLGDLYMYLDNSGKIPNDYVARNYLSYYVDRNIKVIDFLQKQKWISKNKLVVAGHSEGSTIAAKMASKSKKITHLIYAGGNPVGRILSIIQENNAQQTQAIDRAESLFAYWEFIVHNPKSLSTEYGDTPRATYEFSSNLMQDFGKMKIPVLISYGTKDWSAPYNDYLQIEMISQGKKNFTFQTYWNCEHNYYPIKADNTPDFNIDNWEKVGIDWYNWLKTK